MTYQEWLGFMQQYLQSVEKYSSIYSGQQIDAAVGKALNPDTTPTANSSALVTSGGVKSALDMFYIGGAYVDVTANTDATIEVTAPSGYTKGAFMGLYGSSSWGDITKCIVVAQGTDYPNRIKVCSTIAQRISVKILWIK